MYLSGETPLPREYSWMPLDNLRRSLPDDAAERVLLALDCANESRLGPDPGGARKRAARRQRRPPPRQLALRRHQRRRRGRVLDRRDRARPPEPPRRRAHAGHGRGALYRARDRHGPVPVHEHDSQGPSPRRRARRGGRRRAQDLPGRLRERPVREAEAPRPSARTGADLRGRPARDLVPPARTTSPRWGRPSPTRRGSSTTCGRSRAQTWPRSSGSRRGGTPRRGV